MGISKRPSYGRPQHHSWEIVAMVLLVMVIAAIIASF
jgi:hypothetical protein